MDVFIPRWSEAPWAAGTVCRVVIFGDSWELIHTKPRTWYSVLLLISFHVAVGSKPVAQFLLSRCATHRNSTVVSSQDGIGLALAKAFTTKWSLPQSLPRCLSIASLMMFCRRVCKTHPLGKTSRQQSRFWQLKDPFNYLSWEEAVRISELVYFYCCGIFSFLFFFCLMLTPLQIHLWRKQLVIRKLCISPL